MSRRRRWAPAATAGALLILAGALGGCTSDEAPQLRPLGSIPTDDLVYDNRAAGFTMTFPPSWHGRYDVDARSGPIAAAQWPFTTHAITFVYKPVEPDQPEPVLVALLVYHRGGWNQIAPGPNPPGMVVAEQDDDVYVAAVADSNPFPPGSQDGQNFEGMRLTAAQVKEGLTLR